MPTERPGPQQPLDRLADILAKASGGPRPTPLELAELLWLAHHMEPTAEPPAAPAPQALADVVRPPEAPEETPSQPPPGQQDICEPSPPPSPLRAPLHLPAPAAEAHRAPAEPHITLLVPAPPMLRRPLDLQRSLRPLKRRTDAPDCLELDERATADRIAHLGAAPEWWLPVLRPARERWLRLNLVYDKGPTMPVWRPLIHELHTALVQSGIFRTITLHSAGPDGTVRDIPGADGRTVTLLVSDCMGPQWRPGPAGTRWYGTLTRWARRMPLAVVQPLPEHLWRDTALPAAPGRLSAPHPAAAAATLTFTPYDDAVEVAEGTVPLPVLEPEPRWLANWASLIAAPGQQQFPGAAAQLGRSPAMDSDDRMDVAGLAAEDLVLRFRATASPEALRLAGHLAVGCPDVRVMRLVQAAVEPRTGPQHLAEVILSGMLTKVPGTPGSYAFRPGVSDLLLQGIPLTAQGRTTEVLARVGKLIDRRAGRAPGEFRASTPAPSGTLTGADGDLFALVSPESVQRLSDGPERAEGRLLAGRYRLVNQLEAQGTHWIARDTQHSDEVVMVRRYPRPSHALRAGFMVTARQLRRIRHPGINAIRDYGIEDEVPYLVREFVDGRSLSKRLGHSRHGLTAPELPAVVPPLAAAVNALHEQGRPHGGLDTSHVILTSRGPVLSCLDVISYGGGTREDDLRALGHIVRTMHRGTDGPGIQQLPLPLENLSVPEWLAYQLDSAVAELTSDDADTQQLGIDRLLRLPATGDTAREEYGLGAGRADGQGIGRLTAGHERHAEPERFAAVATTGPPVKGRASRQRAAVAAALDEVDEFRSAPEIHDMLKHRGDSVGLTTVYRTLQSLADAREIDVLRTADGESVYRRRSTGGPRHHLVCRVCGKAVEVEGPAVKKWAEAIAAEHGFVNVSHTVELFGTCAECSAG